ncbi:MULTISPECIES: EAL domain-containing protein [Asticcacaulis]|uniref:bifunctional diguanylate cyclase/phosphodiesterase n=1 Tax=Asticcacaulis TaxID=76890 RepID=UPI001AE907D7|nr:MULTISPECIES: EAL domain-containing protein [Asticcacaulis]MBP2161090.1 diguanylate cyclase (GGDEF)-like protein/PAS domain S-box-containing protein [Asticcacaulis solisilvae]MDR6802135.1 diguanylate cyclase (GGDEF)-like protein/PAS domain S-box-containing protein [Asticcacaulis sp. BE141]
MYRILSCLETAHDWKLVLLAALVCIVSCAVTILVLGRARTIRGRGRLRWILTAGAAGGFGIWATHFIAMLAFDPGLPLAFDLPLTLISLLAAMAITAGGAEVAISRGFKGSALAGGAVMGSGVCTMHYLGMMAVSTHGYLRWAPDLVIASIVAGLAVGAVAMWVFEKKTAWTRTGAAGLLVLGIVAHHFTAMGAVTVVPDPRHLPTGLALSPDTMSLILAIMAAGVMGLCAAAVRWGRQMDDMQAANDRRFSTLLEGVRDYAIFMLDPDGRIANWNKGAQRIKGYTGDEVIGRHFAEVSAIDAAARVTAAAGLKTALETGRYEAEGLHRRKDESTFWAHTVITPLYDDQQKLLGFANVTRDITAQKAAQDQILEVSRNLDAALSHMSHGLCLFDANEKLVLSNSRFNSIYGLDSDFVKPGLSLRDLLAGIITLREGHAPDEAKLEAFHAKHRAVIFQPGGGIIVSELLANRTLSIAHRPMPSGGWVTTFDDITERRASEQRIAHMARHDGLTGLPNRVHFNEHLDTELGWAARHGEQVAVVTIDLDRFKDINDQRGHEIGDEALKILAERLAALTGGDGRFVARLGGDEFAAVKRFDQDTDIAACVAVLYNCICEPILVDGIEVTLQASLGVAVYPQDGSLRETLLNNADLALYRAKTPGGDKICFYEPGMDEAARDRRALAKDLQRALANKEFRVFYQVQQDVRTREITGYEALVRWKHPVRGYVSPADFISVAEESGAIVEMGAWVLRAACHEAASWNDRLKIAVNLSPVQLNDVNLIEVVHSALADSGLSPHRLELEITESTIIEDKIRALHILRQIKALGVTIAIDDFGTGYASLDTLNAFPFDKIKIDRSFLMEADKSQQARAIVRAILALGRSLDIPVLAEGVETEGQMALLREEGCDQAQGFLLGRPQEDISPSRLAC